MTTAGVAAITGARRIRPRRLWEYVLRCDEVVPGDRNPWKGVRPVVLLAVMDDRLAAMARDFWDDSDRVLTRPPSSAGGGGQGEHQNHLGRGERRPAEGVRACVQPARASSLAGRRSSEQASRAGLFVGTVSAYRNPRARRELQDMPNDALCELLLVNHLFRLEATAVPR
jgi:hypothetical protein